MTVLAEPENGADARTDARSNGRSDASAQRRACKGASASRGSERDDMALRMVVAKDRALVIDARVVAGIEVDDLRADAIERAIRQRDSFGFKMDGCGAAQAMAAAHRRYATFERRSDGKNDAAVVLDVF